MKKDSTRIDIEIYLVFIVLIAVSVFNAIYSTIIISRNQDASTKIMTVDMPSCAQRCLLPIGFICPVPGKTKKS